MNRRTFLKHTATAMSLSAASGAFGQSQTADYKRADFGLLRDTGYGVGFHWIVGVLPRRGKPKPFAEAVRQFDVHAFVDRVAETGAGHVLFTVNHGMHHLCCPNPEVDRLLKGRTTERDLVMELADALADKNIRLMLYYLSTCDRQWARAVGSATKEPRFFDNWMRVIAWMGQHYGKKVVAWWFDSGRKIMDVGNPPWKEMAAAAKAGFADRLICYNSDIEDINPLTPYQDYWAGEIVRLNYIPRGPTANGLPWYGFTSWHGDSRKPRCGYWAIEANSIGLDWPAPPVQSVIDYYQRFSRVGGTVTFNLLCYQDGSIYDSDLQVMREVKQNIGTR
jgi:hypothetical protein